MAALEFCRSDWLALSSNSTRSALSQSPARRSVPLWNRNLAAALEKRMRQSFSCFLLRGAATFSCFLLSGQLRYTSDEQWSLVYQRSVAQSVQVNSGKIALRGVELCLGSASRSTMRALPRIDSSSMAYALSPNGIKTARKTAAQAQSEQRGANPPLDSLQFRS